MEALIIVAHGSKVKSSNDEVIEIVSQIRNDINSGILVFHAFLELSEPSIFMAINKAIAENCKRIINPFLCKYKEIVFSDNLFFYVKIKLKVLFIIFSLYF